MKILESYKDIVKSLLTEEDVMSHVIKYKDEDGNEKEISVKSALQAGESHPAYKQASDIADKGQAGLAQKDKEEPTSKGLSPDDFERDFDGGEPKKDVKGREYDPMTGKGKGKDSRNEPDDEEYFKSMMGGGEPEDDDWDDDEEEREGWENVEYIKDTDYDDILDDPQSIWNAFDDMEQADIKVPGWMFDKAVDIRDGDGDENDAEELQRGLQNIYDRPEDFKESIKVINGKKYRAIKEDKYGDRWRLKDKEGKVHYYTSKEGYLKAKKENPSYTDKIFESVESKKHLLRENYERIGGK